MHIGIIIMYTNIIFTEQETKQDENEYLLNYFDTVTSCVYMYIRTIIIIIYTSVEDISHFCSNRARLTVSNNNVFSVIVNIDSYLSVLECGGWSISILIWEGNNETKI